MVGLDGRQDEQVPRQPGAGLRAAPRPGSTRWRSGWRCWTTTTAPTGSTPTTVLAQRAAAAGPVARGAVPRRRPRREATVQHVRECLGDDLRTPGRAGRGRPLGRQQLTRGGDETGRARRPGPACAGRPARRPASDDASAWARAGRRPGGAGSARTPGRSPRRWPRAARLVSLASSSARTYSPTSLSPSASSSTPCSQA